jgi:DNA-binding transcriptional LysR family regulator
MFPFTLQQLIILQAIDKTKNFTKAASSLFISQPSLTKHIQNLETNLELILIHRKQNQILFTPNGKVLLTYTEKILRLCEETCRVLKTIQETEQTTVILGASPTVGIYLLPKLVTLFVQKYPHIKVIIQVESMTVLAKKMETKDINLAVIGGYPTKSFQKNWKLDIFGEEELVLIVAPSHPLAKKKKITKNELYHLTFINHYPISNLQKVIHTLLVANNIDPQQLRISLELNSTEAIKTAVKLELGVAFISLSAILNEQNGNTIQVLQIENITLKRSLSWMLPNHSLPSKQFFQFSKNLLEICSSWKGTA